VSTKIKILEVAYSSLSSVWYVLWERGVIQQTDVPISPSYKVLSTATHTLTHTYEYLHTERERERGREEWFKCLRGERERERERRERREREDICAPAAFFPKPSA